MASKSSMVTSSERLGAVGAGVVDEDVEGLGLGDRVLHGGELGDVEHQRIGFLTASADGGCGGLDLGGGAGGERDMRAGIGQGSGGGEADAAAGAGDERALAVEAEGGGGGDVDHGLDPGVLADLSDHAGFIAEQRDAGISNRVNRTARP